MTSGGKVDIGVERVKARPIGELNRRRNEE
jgi:hypothetical protein